MPVEKNNGQKYKRKTDNGIIHLPGEATANKKHYSCRSYYYCRLVLEMP